MRGVLGAQNAWAPEFFLDEAGMAHLLWSSCVDRRLDGATHDWENDSQDHRIWHCTTEDFLTLSQPTAFFDPGHSVIDATVVRHEGLFHLAYKDERGENESRTPHKRIMLTSATNSTGPFRELVGPIGDAAAEGPTLFQVQDRWVLLYDHFLAGSYGASVSDDWQTWAPWEVSVPAGARHASVMRLETAPAWIGEDPAFRKAITP
jgi:hypothetical protein